GLTAENVRLAIEKVRPYAVDVSGGVEQDKGIKDAQKMAAFMQEVNQIRS
ncbi:MAG TPA: N-(5'-phosphoribosyl)anthranilate isomerase, partial [Methylophilaceae bacterium]|nr:N-(5'-phosphoribosyl)anthranilate isomerase [Methylophilaceae bacterium]